VYGFGVIWLAVALAVTLGIVLLRKARPLPELTASSPSLIGWRPSPFKVGRHYRVLHTFQAMRDAFTAGEILVYRSQGWSRYDETTAYYFQAPNDIRIRTWDVPDEDDLSIWKTHFEELTLAVAPALPNELA
jgi:hypothetical protein